LFLEKVAPILSWAVFFLWMSGKWEKADTVGEELINDGTSPSGNCVVVPVGSTVDAFIVYT
jgi:hypothetical protein